MSVTAIPSYVLMIRRSKPTSFRSPLVSQELPLDILPPILAQLSDRKDWHACALVSKTFNRIATPLLYRALDSRVISTVSIFVFVCSKVYFRIREDTETPLLLPTSI
jgi:hypothetical protein